MTHPTPAPEADQFLATDQAAVFDQQHPPRNRVFRPDLFPVQLAVTSVGSEHIMDANEAVRHACQESLTLGLLDRPTRGRRAVRRILVLGAGALARTERLIDGPHRSLPKPLFQEHWKLLGQLA